MARYKLVGVDLCGDCRRWADDGSGYIGHCGHAQRMANDAVCGQFAPCMRTPIDICRLYPELYSAVVAPLPDNRPAWAEETQRRACEQLFELCGLEVDS